MNKLQAIDQLKSSLAQDSLLEFMDYCWQRQSERLITGIHTKAVCAGLDRALEKYRRGESSFLILTLPFRHGKSDMASRYFPAYVFGNFPDFEIMLASYNSALSTEMSRDVQNIMRSENYAKVFNSRISRDSASVSRWGIKDHHGKLFPLGMLGGATGKGADLLIIDDYLKNRADAESPLIRQRQWDGFTNDLMTRLAPVSIVIVMATRWHVDDIIGRIIKRNNPESECYDAHFPKFELLHYPARSDDYPGGYLFPERFSSQWYVREFAQLGEYAASSLLQGNPVLRGGNMIKTEGVKIQSEFPDGLRYVRFWDLASSEKELNCSDPDYTAGALCAVKKIGSAEHFYVADLRYCRAEAPERDRMIVATAKSDGPAVVQGVESVAGYKDAYTTIKRVLAGVSCVRKINVSRDKVIRASMMQAAFDAGNVHFLSAAWNNILLEQLLAFPAAKHDDFVDALAGAFAMARNSAETFRMIVG